METTKWYISKLSIIATATCSALANLFSPLLPSSEVSPAPLTTRGGKMPPRPQTQLLRHPQRAHHHTSTSSHIQTPLSLNRSSLRPTACSLAQTIPYRQQRRLISSNEDGGPNAPGRHQEGKGFYRFKDLPIAGAGIAQEQSVATRNLEAMREKLPNDLGLLLGM